jgi:hypothetical protein
MARLFQSGAEIDAGAFVGSATSTLDPDGFQQGSGAVARDTSVFRNGLASWRFDSGASGFTISMRSTVVSVVDGRSYFLRGYFRAAAAPTATVAFFRLDSGLNGPNARFRTDGKVELWVSNAAQGSPSASSITDSSWHRIELKATATATTTWTAAEVLLDGASVATWSGSIARSTSNFDWGWVQGSPGVSMILNVDDVAVNDSTGASNNSYPGDGSVVLLKPTADSAVGAGWTLGTGTAIAGNTGKTAVSSTPPLGVADLAAGSDPKQIRNAAANANVNYDATITTYTAAGVGASDTINAVVPWVATSAPVATSAKLGTIGVVSNPAITSVNLGATGTAGAFWGGSAAATYGTGSNGWKWSPGTMAERPTVTLGTAPVMRVQQVTASTRIAMVCGMFIYVDYTPAAPAAMKKPRVLTTNVPAMRAALR